MEDFGIDDQDERAAAPPTEREHVPEGTHDFKIVRVINQDYGFDLALQHDDRRYGWVFHRMDRDNKHTGYRLRELRTALAISPEEWRSLEPTEIVDRRVRAEIRHKVGTTGKLWVNVWRYLPTPQLEQPSKTGPAQAATPRTPAAKAAAEWEHVDDIPF